MILHILPDDKFIINFCEMAIKAAGDSIEQMFLVRDKKPYKFLPNDSTYLVDAPINGEVFNRLTQGAKKGDRIILHYLHPFVRRWLASFNTEATLEWVFWSSDFYICMYLNYPHLEPLTAAYMNGAEKPPLSRFKLLHWYRTYLVKRDNKKWERRLIAERDAAAAKISVFHHYIKEEHELIESLIPLKAKFNFFCYSQDIAFDEIYELSKTLSLADSPINPHVPNLMVGNSGYSHANHLDCFQLLKEKTQKVNIIALLSYGEEHYIQKVLAEGNKLFGNRFVSIMDYLAFKQYVVLLMSCKGMMVSLSTPKSMGNIYTLLVLGKRVFINKESLAYPYFKRIGLTVNTIDEFSEELLLRPEDPAVVSANVERIIAMHSYARNYSYVENMIKMPSLAP